MTNARMLQRSKNKQSCSPCLPRVECLGHDVKKAVNRAIDVPDCKSSEACKNGGQYIELAAVREEVKAAYIEV